MYIEFFEGDRATQYDDTIPQWVPNYQLVLQSLPAILSNYLPPTESRRILVAGCGTGQEIAEIRRFSSHWHVTGLDPSPQMIRLAQMKLAHRENDSLLKLQTGIVGDLPELEQFDAATLILVMHFIPDNEEGKIRLLRNIAKRLRKGAPLIISDIFEPDDFVQQKSYFRQYLLAKGMDTQMLEEGLQHVTNDTHRLTEDRFFTLLEEAGFEKPYLFSRAYYYGSWVAVKA
jgi:tRNA (cmo5U34)-methyltransferase